jgi:hypothetical protein
VQSQTVHSNPRSLRASEEFAALGFLSLRDAETIGDVLEAAQALLSAYQPSEPRYWAVVAVLSLLFDSPLVVVNDGADHVLSCNAGEREYEALIALLQEDGNPHHHATTTCERYRIRKGPALQRAKQAYAAAVRRLRQGEVSDAERQATCERIHLKDRRLFDLAEVLVFPLPACASDTPAAWIQLYLDRNVPPEVAELRSRLLPAEAGHCSELLGKLAVRAQQLRVTERNARIELDYPRQMQDFLAPEAPPSATTWPGTADDLALRFSEAFPVLSYAVQGLCRDFDDPNAPLPGLALLLGVDQTSSFVYLPTADHIRALAGQHLPSDYHGMEELLLHRFSREQSVVGHMTRAQCFPVYVSDVSRDIRAHSYRQALLRAEHKLFGMRGEGPLRYKCIFLLPALGAGPDLYLALVYVSTEPVPLRTRIDLAMRVPSAANTTTLLQIAHEQYLARQRQQNAEHMMRWVGGLRHTFTTTANVIDSTIRNSLFPFLGEGPPFDLKHIPAGHPLRVYVASLPEGNEAKFTATLDRLLLCADVQMRAFFDFISKFVNYVYPSGRGRPQERPGSALRFRSAQELEREASQWYWQIDPGGQAEFAVTVDPSLNIGAEIFEREGVRFMCQRLLENAVTAARGMEGPRRVVRMSFALRGEEILECRVLNHLKVDREETDPGSARPGCDWCGQCEDRFRVRGNLKNPYLCAQCMEKYWHGEIASWWLPGWSGGSGTGLGLFMLQRVAEEFYEGVVWSGLHWDPAGLVLSLGFDLRRGERGFKHTEKTE